MAKDPAISLSLEHEHLFTSQSGYMRAVKHLTETGYNGQYFNLDFFVLDENNPHRNPVPYSETRILGAKHANLIICSLLALLEVYGFNHVLNDEDMQEEFAEMVQAAKDLYAEKAIEQIRDGLKSK